MHQLVFTPNENVTHTPIRAFTSSSNIISDIYLFDRYNQLDVQLSWTGAGTGAFTLQGSNDIERFFGQPDAGIVNWNTLADTIQTSAGSPAMFNYSNQGYRWYRVVYTVATGSITLTATVQLKAI